MKTSLQGIAKKAKLNKRRRFHNLYRLLNEENLLDSWRYLNNKRASGVDKPQRYITKNLRQTYRPISRD